MYDACIHHTNNVYIVYICKYITYRHINNEKKTTWCGRENTAVVNRDMNLNLVSATSFCNVSFFSGLHPHVPNQGVNLVV